MNHCSAVLLLALASSGTLAAPGCELRDGGRYVCKAKLTVNAAGQLVIDPDPFEVPKPGAGRKVVAVWKLTNDNYYFQKDGIQLKQANGQFTDPCVSDDNGDCFSVPKPRKFRWKVANTDAFDVPYCVTVYDPNGVPHFFDPTIRNSGIGLNGAISARPALMTASEPIDPIAACTK